MRVQSVNGHSQSASRDAGPSREPSRASAGLLLSLLVALLMVSSPLYCLASGTPSSDDPSAGREVVVGPAERFATIMLPDWNGRSWDWSQMANESGFVRVIIASNESSVLDGLEGWIAGAGEAVVLGDKFSVGFSGLSAAVKVDSLSSLAEANPGVQVYPDFPIKASAADNIVAVGADQMWSRVDAHSQSVTGAGMIVAVIDTGIDYTHPDLGGGFGPSYKVAGGYDFYNNDANPMDDNGHGTHVAGIIAASGSLKGVAPDAKLLAYKALGSDGSGQMSDVISAIQRALDPDANGDTSDHADVISMSLGGAGEAGDPVSLAVREAVSEGAVVVVAAGNEGPSMGTVASPGIAPEAITVGAVDASGNIAGFSSRGTNPSTLVKPEISAPGVDINSTVPRSGASLSSPSGYMVLSGTSMATPHVSGAAALLLQLHPGWTPEQVKSALVSGSAPLEESLWVAGAGELWVPGSSDTTLFALDALISYGNAGASTSSLSVTNLGASATFSVSTHDFRMLAPNGSTTAPIWANRSQPSPTSASLQTGMPSPITLSVAGPDSTTAEGYYEGSVVVSGSAATLRVPFGYVVLSRVNIHVIDIQGHEVTDPFGEVWAYDDPDANVVACAKSDTRPSPPASFLLPSGSYSVHAMGHQLVYTYADPYILSSTFSLAKSDTKDVYLRMTEARQMVLDLETDQGMPIYAKDYRAYVRHVGEHNVSFHLTGSDYFTVGSELPGLARSRTIYVSDTSATVGISISGYSYSPLMWSFISRNMNHWFESISGNSAGFYIESSSDLHYLLAWEFQGVDSSSPLSLSVQTDKASVYTTKYDIPGQISQPWCDWNTRLPQGAESTFYVRRDTQAPINPFFSGMTRKTIVQGVFAELYYPGGLFNGYSEAEYYSPDYSHVLHAATASQIYLPDRNFLTSVDGIVEALRIGSGPYYPAVRTENTASSLVLFHPLLRDQSGAKVSGMNVPRMQLFVDGSDFGIYQLSEYRARPDAKRVVALPETGSYVAHIEYQPTLQVTNDVVIDLGFTVPASDMNPPAMTGLAMSQRFAPGALVPIRFTASDSVSSVSATLSWRPSDSASWINVPLTTYSAGDFGASIQTSASDTRIDLKIKLSDSSGNYLEYTASNAALAQIPVVFELSASSANVDYKNSNFTVQLVGKLTDASGNPLHPQAAVPLELFVGGTKVGMILDEHVTGSSHAHDGIISFDWHLNPYHLFTDSNQDVVVSVQFDLGIYAPVTRTITLHSVAYVNDPPVVELLSPADGSTVAAGTVIDLSITDSSSLVAEYSVDNLAKISVQSPYDISTAAWSDGDHRLAVKATDIDGAATEKVYNFTVDALDPSISITSPIGARVPTGSLLKISAYDARLTQVSYSVDYGPTTVLSPPYEVDMTSWAIGHHSVSAEALDVVGHRAWANISFEIMDSPVVVSVVSPAENSVVRPGTPIVLEVLGNGYLQCSYSEGDVWQSVLPPYIISTADWADGTHTLSIIATNDLGGWFDLTYTIIIDNTPPLITLESLLDGAVVAPSTQATLKLDDPNFQMAQWTLGGTNYMTVSRNPIIFFDTVTSDGIIALLVSAWDLAGNKAWKNFTFLMDTKAPSVTISGISTLGAVALGAKVVVNADDALLSGVTLSIDGSLPSPIEVPFEVDTGALSPSVRHSLSATAFDMAGKSTNKLVEFYVDGSAPVIELTAPAIFVAGSSLEVHANVSDDLAVSGVTLYHVTSSGTTLALQMSPSGGSFVTSLNESYLWDGLSLYADVVDSVGHVTRSAVIVVHASSAPADELPPPSNPDEPIDLSFITSIPVLAAIVTIVVCSLAIALVLRRRRRDEEDWYASAEPGDGQVFDWPEEPSELAFEEPVSAPVAAESTAVGKLRIESLDEPFMAEEVEEEVEETQPTRPSLIDAIPDVVVEPVKDESLEDEDDTDYGELIEKELVRGALQRSVYKEDMRLLEVIRELETMALDMENIVPPKKPVV